MMFDDERGFFLLLVILPARVLCAAPSRFLLAFGVRFGYLHHP